MTIQIPKKSVEYFQRTRGTKPDASDRAFYRKRGRWPSFDENRFWNAKGRWPAAPKELRAYIADYEARAERARQAAAKRKAAKEAHLKALADAAAKRRAKSLAKDRRSKPRKIKESAAEELARIKKEMRSAAAKRGWETRRAKPKAQRDFEKRREKKLRELLKLRTAKNKKTLGKADFYRYYDNLVIDVETWSPKQIADFMINMRSRGVKNFRYERYVPTTGTGEYDGWRSPSGFLSTKWQSLQNRTDNQIIEGYWRTDLPSITSMLNPGIDFLKYIILGDFDVKNFPADFRRKFKKAKRNEKQDLKKVSDVMSPENMVADHDEDFDDGNEEFEDDFEGEDE